MKSVLIENTDILIEKCRSASSQSHHVKQIRKLLRGIHQKLVNYFDVEVMITLTCTC